MYKFGLDWLSQPWWSTQHRRKDYHKNWVECAKELGWQQDMLVQKLSDGRTLTKVELDLQRGASGSPQRLCCAESALASKPSAKGSREFTLRIKPAPRSDQHNAGLGLLSGRRRGS